MISHEVIALSSQAQALNSQACISGLCVVSKLTGLTTTRIACSFMCDRDSDSGASQMTKHTLPNNGTKTELSVGRFQQRIDRFDPSRHAYSQVGTFPHSGRRHRRHQTQEETHGGIMDLVLQNTLMVADRNNLACTLSCMRSTSCHYLILQQMF